MITTSPTSPTISFTEMQERKGIPRAQNVSHLLGNRSVSLYPISLRLENGIQYSDVAQVLKQHSESLRGSLWESEKPMNKVEKNLIIALALFIMSPIVGGMMLTSPLPQIMPENRRWNAYGVPDGTSFPAIVYILMLGIFAAVFVTKQCQTQKTISAIENRLQIFDPLLEATFSVTPEELVFSYPYLDDLNKRKLNFGQTAAIRRHSSPIFEKDYEMYSDQQQGYWCFLKRFKEADKQLQAEMLESSYAVNFIIEDPHFFVKVVRSTKNATLLLPAAAAIVGQDINELGNEECEQLQDFLSEIAITKSIVEVLLCSPPIFLPTITFSNEKGKIKLPVALVKGCFPNFQIGKEKDLHLPKNVDLNALSSYFSFQSYGYISLQALQANGDLFTSEPYILYTIAAHFKDEKCRSNLRKIIKKHFDLILQNKDVLELLREFREAKLETLSVSLQSYYIENVFVQKVDINSKIFHKLLTEANTHKDLSLLRESCLKRLSIELPYGNFSSDGSVAATEVIKLNRLLNQIKEYDTLSSAVESGILKWIEKNPVPAFDFYKQIETEKNADWLKELMIILFNKSPNSFYFTPVPWIEH